MTVNINICVEYKGKMSFTNINYYIYYYSVTVLTIHSPLFIGIKYLCFNRGQFKTYNYVI